MGIISMYVEVEPGIYQARKDAIKMGADMGGYPVYMRNPNKPVMMKEQAARPPMQSFTGKIVADIYIKRFTGRS